MILAEPIFLSLQWEWPNTWKPSIFVRFYWCNLCCKWCDSLYAVNNPESIIKKSVSAVVEEIKNLNCHNIVFTWWEPTLFEEDIAKLPRTEKIKRSLDARLKYNEYITKLHKAKWMEYRDEN